MSVLDPNAPVGERLRFVTANFATQATLRRLLASIGAGLLLSLMVGQQEGNTQAVDGSSFRAGLLHDYRYLIFGLIGIILFALITFWPVISPYVRTPGAAGVASAFVLVLVALLLLKWYDGAGSVPGSTTGSSAGKYGPVSDIVAKTPSLGFPASFFFGITGYLLWLACLVLGIAAVASRLAVLGWILAALGVFSAFCAYYGHDQFVELAEKSGFGPDHSLGVYVATLGFLVTAGTGLVVVFAKAEHANPREFVDRVIAWRAGFAAHVVAAVLALIALVNASWFSPVQLNRDFRGLAVTFDPTAIDALPKAWIDWLAPVFTAVTVLGGIAAAWLRNRVLGAVIAVLGLVGLVLNLYAMYGFSDIGAQVAPQFGKLWQNLGSGGWVMSMAFGLMITGGVLTLTRQQAVPAAHTGTSPAPADAAATEPATTPEPAPGRLHEAAQQASGSATAKSFLPAAIAIALFFPPTLTGEWQNTLVTQIGPFLLLAVGLNVVIGWAGLLDLGYIAFYAVGAYTTAYFTGSLPVKPPSWLDFFHSPLWSIPFAVAAALIAGVLLGAPTLRLRGDYLAIVTLGFGEIIQVVATNNPGNFTGGARGPTVPNPVIEIGGFGIHFGQDNLPYWYLLLFLLVAVVILFYKLEGSRIGRAWAAIREDEIAAQASGVNTTRVKLLAFAIGASTSGLAGVYSATLIGYFDPQAFLLQISILIVAYVVFGGMGSLAGAIAGAAVLTWLPQFLKSQVPQTDQVMWVGAVIMLMMIFRPAGLIPAKRRAAELHGLDAPSSSEVRAVPAGEGM